MSPSSGLVPRRRASGLVSEELDGETLLYVEASHKAFCLNAPAARVWKSIDGARDVETIARSAELEPALVATTLREMYDAGLLETPADALPASEVNLSRRRMIRAGLVAIPIILAITVPRAAEAASCVTGLPGTPCDPAHRCCTGVCNENIGTCG